MLWNLVPLMEPHVKKTGLPFKKETMMKISILFYSLLFSTLYAQESIPNLELPFHNEKEITKHIGYTLSYNENHEQANWVAYQLTKEETTKRVNRTNRFISDPAISSGSAENSDYQGNGYDRGHLAPAADMSWSQRTMDESFLFSNMSPQDPGFNRGIWKKLEELCRSWAIENNAIYIVTGPVLTNNLPTIGQNKVSIPSYYYKIILDYDGPEKKAIGFIMPNKPSKNELASYAVSIDSIEHLTGINFFPLLNDLIEERIESKLCVQCWSFSVKNTPKKEVNNSEKQKTKNTLTNSVICKGITKSGTRCKHHTLSKNGYCKQHGG